MAAKLVELYAQHVEHPARGVAEQANRRRLVRAELHGNPLDVEAVVKREVHKLDIECEPIDAAKPKELIGHVATHAFQPALRIEKAASHQRADDLREHARCEPSAHGELRSISRVGQRTVSDYQ